ncbi:hypothetical protein B0H10DRAFT_2128662 [Mycena sp. CBHHK59/15]|nr:hypothetical protein B0H10DRAFT_2149491 [Mycena sp. CBHHK59/15]KAJ6549479.1 hypothetical protein B0H10DRAFT_2128662 [Mycena sp. CBHHK59/15]
MPSIVKYDDRPSGKSLPARPTLIESLPEAVGFNRVCWASVHICCVGIKQQDVSGTEWFCDDDCRENAGGRRKRARR